MKTTVDKYDFIEAFRRIDRYDNFGCDGLKALFEYLEQYEDDTGEELELDVIALCCDYSLYRYADIVNEYDIFDADEIERFRADDDEDGMREYVQETLRDHTQVIPVDDDSLIIAAF